jgi:hypothetical protein
MKIRIKRKKVMKEAAISPEEYLEDGPEIKLEIGDWGLEINAGDIGSIEAYPIACKPNGITVYSIAWAGAKGGYGPLLYDIALEALWKFQKAALTSDRAQVSTHAKAVWDYYLENRDDVEKIQMDIDKETIAQTSVPLKHLTEPTDDDCPQKISIRYASKIRGAKNAPNWYQQSTAYAYIKRDPTTILKLGDHLIIDAD